jgi:hypothetical protein
MTDLLHADKYEVHGTIRAGKIHAVREGERTYCGQELRYTGGFIAPGDRGTVTCKGCMRSLDTADSQEQARQEWEQRASELARQREEENAQWWAWYSEYLQSAEWASRRHRILQRTGGLCEGCRENSAVHRSPIRTKSSEPGQ